MQCVFAVAEVRKVTANLSQAFGFAVTEHLLQFCGICGCGIECKFAVPSSDPIGQKGLKNDAFDFGMRIGYVSNALTS